MSKKEKFYHNFTLKKEADDGYRFVFANWKKDKPFATSTDFFREKCCGIEYKEGE